MDAPILPHEYRNILEVRDFSTNDYMLISDMLITDYSSVIFEYALLGKPIAFFCYDLLIYDRDFYLKYPDDLPGDVFKTQEELTEKAHNFELEKSGNTVVCLDYGQNGIGSNSCGPKLRKEYRLDQERFTFEMKLLFGKEW